MVSTTVGRYSEDEGGGEERIKPDHGGGKNGSA